MNAPEQGALSGAEGHGRREAIANHLRREGLDQETLGGLARTWRRRSDCYGGSSHLALLNTLQRR